MSQTVGRLATMLLPKSYKEVFMAKRIWEFSALNQISDDTKFLVSQGENTRVVPGSLINQIAARIDSIIAGSTTEVSAAEIADARVQANGQTATSLGNAIRWVYNALLAEEHATYTEFDGGVVSDGALTVTQRPGLCFITGNITLSKSIADWKTILSSSKVPAPQHGRLVPFEASQWGTSYARTLRGKITPDGELQIVYGVAGNYVINVCYPIE